MTRSELMRHVQESCRESEEQLAALADNLAGGMVYQIDSGPDGTQRRLTYVSRGVETLHELTREDVGDNPLFIYQSIRPDYRQMVVDREEEAIRLMKRFYLEAPVILLPVVRPGAAFLQHPGDCLPVMSYGMPSNWM